MCVQGKPERIGFMTDDEAFKLGDQSFRKVLDREVFAAGAIIFREGEPGKTAYIVMRGEVEIITTNAAGQQIVLTTVKKGQFFGELALMTQAHRTATAITRTGCEVLFISQDKLEQKLKNADPFLRFWIQYLCGRVVDLSKRAKS